MILLVKQQSNLRRTKDFLKDEQDPHAHRVLQLLVQLFTIGFQSEC